MKNRREGFTLIEILAVIIILGILLLVAIPSVYKYINDSRKSVMIDTTKRYARSFLNMWVLGNISCYRDNNNTSLVSSEKLPADIGYYFAFSTQKGKQIIGGVTHNAPYVDLYENANGLLSSGGKSPFGNRELNGVIRIDTRTKPFKIYITTFDGKNGIINPNNPNGDVYSRMINYTELDKENVSTSNNTGFTYYGGDCILTK